MGERWLYGVDGGLLEQDEPDPWRDPWLDGPPRNPICGCPMEAREPRVERIIVREEPQEAMLHWIGRVLGGAGLVDGLDDAPLPERESLRDDLLPPSVVELARVVDEHLDLVGTPPIVGGELITVYRRLLVEAGRLGLLHLWRDLEPEKIAATVIHCAIKANALTGNDAPFAVATFLAGLGVPSGQPAHRSRRLALLLGGSQWPHGSRPAGAPGAYVLGDQGLLVSRYRHDLIASRELARREVAAREDSSG